MIKREYDADSVEIAAYGIYLMHGGDPKRFDDMSVEDVQTLFTTYTAMQSAHNAELLEGIARIFRGKEE